MELLMADEADVTLNTETTGSRLPAEVPWSGAQSGLGLKPDLEAIAGEEEAALPPRPVRALANDAAFDHGIIAEGRMDGEVNPVRTIPWI
jgi:hypothetical protein